MLRASGAGAPSGGPRASEASPPVRIPAALSRNDDHPRLHYACQILRAIKHISSYNTQSPMSTLAVPISAQPIHYPDSDGKPMAENTLQYDLIALDMAKDSRVDAIFGLIQPVTAFEEFSCRRMRFKR